MAGKPTVAAHGSQPDGTAAARPTGAVPAGAGRLRVIALVLPMLLLSACVAFSPPQPWQKGDLARPEMRIGAEALAERNARHIHTSRETASGGQGVGAGGCGCN